MANRTFPAHINLYNFPEDIRPSLHSHVTESGQYWYTTAHGCGVHVIRSRQNKHPVVTIKLATPSGEEAVLLLTEDHGFTMLTLPGETPFKLAEFGLHWKPEKYIILRTLLLQWLTSLHQPA